MRSRSLTPDAPGFGAATSTGHGRPAPDTYLTDGVDLFRVVRVAAGSGGEYSVELENCLTLEATLYPAESFARMPLSPVIPARESVPVAQDG